MTGLELAMLATLALAFVAIALLILWINRIATVVTLQSQRMEYLEQRLAIKKPANPLDSIKFL